jgi:hypothetical protein
MATPIRPRRPKIQNPKSTDFPYAPSKMNWSLPPVLLRRRTGPVGSIPYPAGVYKI